MGNLSNKVKTTKKKATARARLARTKVKKIRGDIDQRLIDFASQSLEQLRHKFEEKTHLDLEKDMADQLGKIILQKAKTIRESLHKKDNNKTTKKTKKKQLRKIKLNKKKLSKKSAAKKVH